MTHKLLESEAFAAAVSRGGAACRTGASAIWMIGVGGPTLSRKARPDDGLRRNPPLPESKAMTFR
jgi:hypothetical protein